MDQLHDELFGERKKKLGRSSKTLATILEKPGMRLRILHGCFIMLFQQLVGINSVVFYSHDIFARVATDSNGVENTFLTTLYGVLFMLLNVIFFDLCLKFNRLVWKEANYSVWASHRCGFNDACWSLLCQGMI